MKLAFIQDWIQFYETHKDEFSDNFNENLETMSPGHFFIAKDPLTFNYNLVFKSDYKQMYYTIQILNNKFKVYGPTITDSNTISADSEYDSDASEYDTGEIIYINKDFYILEELYNYIMNHQHKVDQKTLNYTVNYKPYNGNKPDMLYNEFKHITNITGPVDSISLEMANFLHLRLKQELKQDEIIVCFVKQQYYIFGKIFSIIKKDGIYNLFLKDKLYISKCSKEFPSCIEYIPFTFENKTLVNPFSS